MNFCITDGESIVATRYINSRHDEAASLVQFLSVVLCCTNLWLTPLRQWFSSGTTFSEYSEGGHYKMSKMDKRENIILVRDSCSCVCRLSSAFLLRLPASH